jgi:ElaA protein
VIGVHRSAWADLPYRTAYQLLRLRAEVFVVEQSCLYADLDGRDLEPDAEHCWTADESGPTSYLRVITEPDGALRVGRVCTRADARAGGLAGLLMAAAMARAGGRDVVLNAQAHLAGWYARYGFTASGPEFLDDGIPHLPMRRPRREEPLRQGQQ